VYPGTQRPPSRTTRRPSCRARRSVLVVDELPRTPTGKPVKRKLPERYL
jgi:acyl-CoA synthetase (AMP-forming)/AMP-acid ligase II